MPDKVLAEITGLKLRYIGVRAAVNHKVSCDYGFSSHPSNRTANKPAGAYQTSFINL
jgi:hypothetical protein